MVVIRDFNAGLRYFIRVNKLMDIRNLQPLKENWVYKLTLTDPFYYYSIFSGTDSGYGYFAPRIGRSTTLECVQKKLDGTYINTYYPEILKTYEGIQRYSVSISNLYSSISQIKDSTARKDYFDYATKIIGEKLIRDKNTGDSVIAEVTYSYFVFPTIVDLQKGEKPTMVNITKIEL